MKYEAIKKIIKEEKDSLNAMIINLQKQLDELPKGSVYFRDIGKKTFLYRSKRVGKEVVSEYIGPASSKEALLAYNQDLKRRAIKNSLMNAKKELKKLSIKKVLKEYDDDLTEFAIAVSTVDSKEPSAKARQLLKLLEHNVIDLETYDFAIRRLHNVAQ